MSARFAKTVSTIYWKMFVQIVAEDLKDDQQDPKKDWKNTQ